MALLPLIEPLEEVLEEAGFVCSLKEWILEAVDTWADFLCNQIGLGHNFIDSYMTTHLKCP